MINKTLWQELKIIGRHDFDENDPMSRGPFVVLGSSGVVDGNVMDVYGETLDDAEKMANDLLEMIAFCHPSVVLHG